MRVLLAAALALSAQTASARDGADGIPDLRIARAKGDVVAAWLIAPTTRYEHFVLGSRYEAGGVRLKRADGSTVDLMLGEDEVFEDRTPRIADLDRDGTNEVILVKSHKAVGSSLVAINLVGVKTRIVSETPPNGLPRRWLNPAGIGDFLGNGKLQVALVRMPHLQGKLEFWSFTKGRLRNEGALVKVSNHQIGSAKQGLSAVVRRKTGDLLVIPSFNFRSLKVIAATPAPRELQSIPLKGRVTGDLSVDGDKVRVPLEGGKRQTVSIER